MADLISRQAVHDMLENLPITVEDKWFNWLQKACIRLAGLPSVQPQTEPPKIKCNSDTIKQLRDMVADINCEEIFSHDDVTMPMWTSAWRERMFDLIDELPSVQPEQKWIPVSERLPEDDGDYLLFGKVVEDDTDNIFIGMYDACVEKFGYWENYYDRNTLGFLDSELIEYNKVVAWMPLPETYKAESEEA